MSHFRLSRHLSAWAVGIASCLAVGSVGRAAEPPVLMVVTLDSSGSIARSGLESGRKLSLQVLQQLPTGTEVALITFDDESRVVLEQTSDPVKIRAAFEKPQIAGTRTALHDALYDASRYLKEARGERKILLLITDGLDEGSALDLDDGLKIAQESRVPVLVIGVGKVQERVLRRIAKLTSGLYLPASDATAAALAQRIKEIPIQEAIPPVTTFEQKGPSVPSAPSSVAPQPSAKTSTPAVSEKRTPRMRWWPWALGLLVLGGLALWFIRRRTGPECPNCGRALATPLSTCAFCSPTKRSETIRSTPPTPPPATGSALPPTLLGRMANTEEFLEKTITLRERPVLAVQGGSTSQVYPLKSDAITSLGRANANDIVLTDKAISSEHCRIRPEPEGFVLYDLKSTNGTSVNDRPITRHPLAVGDVIKVGETRLQFRMEPRI